MNLRTRLRPAKAFLVDPGLALGIAVAGVSIRRNYERRSLPDLLDRISRSRASRGGRRPTPLEIARQVDRLVPALFDDTWGPCVGRALLLFQVLWKGQYRAHIHFGVLTTPRVPLRGHAWVSLQGEPVGESVDPRGIYEETYRFPEG